MDRRVRWGVLGAARVARRRVIPAIVASDNGEVAALASRDGEKARALAQEFAIARVYDSYQALLDDPDIDAVYNPLPNTLHAEWTIRAAAAGKAVLCEKPLARDAVEAARMVEACARHGVLLMEGFMYRFHPQNVRVRDLLSQGAIGDVGGVRAGFSYRMEPLDPANVRLQPDLGGGALMDVGCYAVNAARMVLGDEPLRVAACRDFDPRFGVDMALAGVLAYADGRFATIDCSFKAGYSGWYMAIGSAGTIEVPRAFTPGSDDTVIVITDAQNNRREERFAGVDQYQLMVEAFGAALLSAMTVPYPPLDGVLNMRVLHALARSAVEGRAVDVVQE